MEVRSFVVNPIGENCYIISEGKEGAIIDAGAFAESDWRSIKRYLEDKDITLKYALQTHMHFDHVYGLHFVERDYGIRPLCHSLEQSIYNQAAAMSQSFLGVHFELNLPRVDSYLHDGQEILLGNSVIEVMHTPGHTPGCLCFYVKDHDVLFSGDTLFQGSIGRTDLEGGSMSMEISSIRERLFPLPDHTMVYPGHGGPTTIGDEKKYNMYF